MREIKVNKRAGIRNIECHKTQPNSSGTIIFVMYKEKQNQNGKSSILFFPN